MRKPALSALFAAGAALALSNPVLAQPDEADRSLNFISGGAAWLPDYTGSDDYRVIPFGAFRYEAGDVVIRSDGPGLAVDLYSEGAVTAGVYGRWAAGRNDVDDAVVALLEEIDNSVLVGGFVDVTVSENIFNDFDQISLGARVGADVLGRFDGIAWSTSASYTTPISQTSLLSLSASVSGFSDDYADTLFSVDAAGAAASGLAQFEAEGGVQDVSLTAILNYGIGGDWSVTGFFSVAQLMGDYADSPIVSVRGDEVQTFTGIALGRRF
jgi:outer membrane protein